MGYPAQTGDTASRPGTVSLAANLLYLIAALQIVGLVMLLLVYGDMSDAIKSAFEGTEAEGAEGFVMGITIGTAILALLFGIGLAILAAQVNKGRNGARITTWVIAGLFICCVGGGLLSSASGFSDMGGGSGDGNAPSSQEIENAMADALPGWYNPVSVTLSVISLIALIAVIVLLALPASNAFFRKKPAQTNWEPPVPPAASA